MIDYVATEAGTILRVTHMSQTERVLKRRRNEKKLKIRYRVPDGYHTKTLPSHKVKAISANEFGITVAFLENGQLRHRICASIVELGGL